MVTPVYCKSCQSLVNHGVIWLLPFRSVASGPDTVTNTEGHRQTQESLPRFTAQIPFCANQSVNTHQLSALLLSVWSSSVLWQRERGNGKESWHLCWRCSAFCCHLSRLRGNLDKKVTSFLAGSFFFCEWGDWKHEDETVICVSLYPGSYCSSFEDKTVLLVRGFYCPIFVSLAWPDVVFLNGFLHPLTHKLLQIWGQHCLLLDTSQCLEPFSRPSLLCPI